MSVIVFEGTHGAGKSTTIEKLNEKYNLECRKSIPDWFRKYLQFARGLEPVSQKKVYMIGHEANYLSLDENKDYVLDRFFYTTIIRLNYDLHKSIEETVREILNINLEPAAVIYLKAEKEIILKRLKARDNYPFDEDFFEYEYKIFMQLNKTYDKIIIIDNSSNIDDTIKQIDKELEVKHLTLVRRENERGV